MLPFILALVCSFLAVAFAAVYRVYGSVTPTELKRRARRGDELAALLYRPIAFGFSTKVVVAGLGLLSAYFALVLFEHALGVWLTGLVVTVLGICGLIFVATNGGVNRVSVWFASKLSPALGWMLERSQPVFFALTKLISRLPRAYIHSGIYEKEDLVALLDKQSTQPDNRIDPAEIELLKHALQFGDKKVLNVLTPKRVVHNVAPGDSIGPVLMDELHATGHSRFPVYDSQTGKIVGVLYLHDLVSEKHTGHVRDVMRTQVRYVHEDFSLFQTLQAFLKTQQHLFIVVNSFEEYVGIITIEDVVEQIIGSQIVDEFDRYDDMRAVAAVAAKDEHAAHVRQDAHHEKPARTTPDATEVVK